MTAPFPPHALPPPAAGKSVGGEPMVEEGGVSIPDPARWFPAPILGLSRLDELKEDAEVEVELW